MTPKGERRMRACLWGGAGVLAALALVLAGDALLGPHPPRPLPPAAPAAPAAAPKLSPQELQAFAQRKMSRSIVKAVVPPPPKPAVPPLDLVVRLSGIIDYGPESPREAFIEIRQSGQTKSYRVGDPMPPIGAVIKGISDTVTVEYDGKLWTLSDRGASPAPVDPGTTAGTKP